MSVRSLLTTATAALLAVGAFATPAAAQVLTSSAGVDSYTLTSGRLWATAAALLGVVGVVVGGLALARSARRTGDGGRRMPVVALLSGLLAAAGGALNLAVADGGPGTGNGVIGGALAVVLGLTATALGGLVLARMRSTDARTGVGS